MCLCVCLCALSKTIFGNTCFHTPLSSLIAVSNSSYMGFDIFSTDRALGGQASGSQVWGSETQDSKPSVF